MVRFSLPMMGFVVLCLWAAVTEEAEYLKYKDPKQALNVRIKDLMSRMTLEEKIGQMVQIERLVASSDVMKNYFIDRPKVPERRSLGTARGSGGIPCWVV